MADLLRREMAPVVPEAWGEIDGQAARILTGNLSARAIVDVDGPHGWGLSAVNLGGLQVGKAEPVKGVKWGLREVLPLLEIRVSFNLGVQDLDTLARGGKTPELGPVVDAARKAALFEERALYLGFPEGGVRGIVESSPHKPVALPKSADGFARAVEDAVHAVQAQGIGGPFELVLGRDPYQTLTVGDERGYPLKRRVLEMLGGGKLHWTPALEGGAVVSARGGDFELTLGQDLSIGYADHDTRNVTLYITESFTFRVLEPAAAVELKLRS